MSPEPDNRQITESKLGKPHRVKPSEFPMLRWSVIKWRETSDEFEAELAREDLSIEAKQELERSQPWTFAVVTTVGYDYDGLPTSLHTDSEISENGRNWSEHLFASRLIGNPERVTNEFGPYIDVQTVTAEEMAGKQFSYSIFHKTQPRPSASL